MKTGVKLLCSSSISRHAVSLPSGSKLRCPTNEQPQKRPGDERNNNRWFMNQTLPDLNPPPEQMGQAYYIAHVIHNILKHLGIEFTPQGSFINV